MAFRRVFSFVTVDVVEDVLETPNILVWSSDWFIKEPNDGKVVSWHQGSYPAFLLFCAANI